jgi:glycosyltransferase involved in cell wall biosynthesis
VFVMPRKSTEWADAPAMWITVAGWADAARKQLGHAWVVTRDGVYTPDDVLTFTRPRLISRSTGATGGSVLLRTAAKDALRAREARRQRDVGEQPDWAGADLAFVWQHHDPFHTAGAPLARRHGVPLVTYVHAPQVWESARWGVRRPGWGPLLERFGERPPLRDSDVVACVSEEVATEVERLGVDPARVIVSPMAVDADRFTPEVPAAAVRDRLGISANFVVGWTGSFRRFHGLEQALEAFRIVGARSPDSRLLLVGDGPERAALEETAESLGIANQVVFAGAVAHEELPEYVAAMDATVVTARSGHAFHYSPQKMREYMAAARPVVAPRVGDVARTLTDGVDGLLYGVGDVDELGARLLELHDDAHARARIGGAGRASVLQTGTWDARLQQLLGCAAFGSSPGDSSLVG